MEGSTAANFGTTWPKEFTVSSRPLAETYFSCLAMAMGRRTHRDIIINGLSELPDSFVMVRDMLDTQLM